MVDLCVTPVITEIRIYADKNGKYHILEERRSDGTYGANVKTLAVSLYSEGVMSNDRIAAFLNAAGNDELGLSAGSVYGFCKKFAGQTATSIFHLKNELLNQKAVATNATTITVNGRQNYVRNFSTENIIVYHTMQKKIIPAPRDLDFLKNIPQQRQI